LFERWLEDDYGRHFLLSCATAQHLNVAALLDSEHNHVGIIELDDGTPIGAMAYLDIDRAQRRAELRKLIGERSARGKGYAEEAPALWIKYGVETLGLEKVFVRCSGCRIFTGCSRGCLPPACCRLWPARQSSWPPGKSSSTVRFSMAWPPR
jgi:hypothetical protein